MTFGCPNQPPCPHPNLVHDIEDFSDPKPTCCAEGCLCGQPTAVADEVKRAQKIAATWEARTDEAREELREFAQELATILGHTEPVCPMLPGWPHLLAELRTRLGLPQPGFDDAEAGPR